jgi:hypothetical protein
MAITLVGTVSATAAFPGTGSGSISLSSISIQQNDFVIVAISVGNVVVDLTISSISGNNNGAYTNSADLYGNGTNSDTNLIVATKKQGATVDTTFSFTLAGTGIGSADYNYVARVYRGLDTTTPIESGIVQTGQGSGTDLADPPSITPTTTGAVIVAVYGGAQQSSLAWTAPANMSNFVQARQTTGVGGQHGIIGMGDAAWTSGLFNPNAVTGGSADSRDSWASATMVLKPFVDVTAPTITSAANHTVMPYSSYAITLTADESVTWTKTGGANSADFTLTSNTLTLGSTAPNTSKVVQVTATDTSSNATNQTVTVNTLAKARRTTRNF